jgi:hypothetical protein
MLPDVFEHRERVTHRRRRSGLARWPSPISRSRILADRIGRIVARGSSVAQAARRGRVEGEGLPDGEHGCTEPHGGGVSRARVDAVRTRRRAAIASNHDREHSQFRGGAAPRRERVRVLGA